MEWDGKGSGAYKPNRGLGSALKSPQLVPVSRFNSAIFPFGPTLLFAPSMLLDVVLFYLNSLLLHLLLCMLTFFSVC